MGRRGNYTHLDTGSTVTEHRDREWPVILCTNDGSFLDRSTKDADRVDCPKCAAALSLMEIAAYNRANPNRLLTLEKADNKEAQYYRYAYRALIGAEHVGYIVMEGAYARTRWYITNIKVENDGSIKTGHHLEKDSITALAGKRVPYDSKGARFIAKEHALLHIPALFEQGILRTKAKTIQDRAEHMLRVQRINAEEAVQDAEEKRLRKEALDALIEIRDTLPISNFQRSGVEYAILVLMRKPGD